MKIYLKVIGVVHVILAFLKSSPAAQTALKMALGSGTDTPRVAQRLLTIATPNNHRKHTHICKPKTNTKKQYTNTSKQRTKLSYNYSTRYNDRVDIKNA